jgi:hypothetical protein
MPATAGGQAMADERTSSRLRNFWSTIDRSTVRLDAKSIRSNCSKAFSRNSETWPAATNLVSRGASGRPEPPLHNARNADLELGRDRTTALPGRNRRNHTLAQIKRIGSGHQMLASIPANTLNHIRNNRGIPPIQKKSSTL